MADALDNNIFIVIDAESDCELYGGQVVARTCYEAKPVNLAIGICTYHREESVRTILQQIYTTFFEQSILADNIGVFVADNGGTLTESDYPDRGVKVMKNKNVGGPVALYGVCWRRLRILIKNGHIYCFWMIDTVWSLESLYPNVYAIFFYPTEFPL